MTFNSIYIHAVVVKPFKKNWRWLLQVNNSKYFYLHYMGQAYSVISDIKAFFKLSFLPEDIYRLQYQCFELPLIPPAAAIKKGLFRNKLSKFNAIFSQYLQTYFEIGSVICTEKQNCKVCQQFLTKNYYILAESEYSKVKRQKFFVIYTNTTMFMIRRMIRSY